MDVARRSDGSWLIVELGDGQVAGLPENAAIPAFYESLIAALSDGRCVGDALSEPSKLDRYFLFLAVTPLSLALPRTWHRTWHRTR